MLIFLDIDGVLVPAKSWESPEILNDGFPKFSSKAVHVLQKLITDDDIVMLTTSHKSNFNINEWKEIFNRRGLSIKNLKSLNNNINNLSRKDEILTWLSTNKHDEDFIIIDDDKSLNSLPLNIKKNLILTSSMIGLIGEHLIEAKGIISRLKLA